MRRGTGLSREEFIFDHLQNPAPAQLSYPAADFDRKEALHGGIRGLRVAYSPDWGYAPVDPEVREVVGRAVKVLMANPAAGT